MDLKLGLLNGQLRSLSRSFQEKNFKEYKLQTFAGIQTRLVGDNLTTTITPKLM